jgi:hypothetical protein
MSICCKTGIRFLALAEIFLRQLNVIKLGDTKIRGAMLAGPYLLASKWPKA